MLRSERFCAAGLIAALVTGGGMHAAAAPAEAAADTVYRHGYVYTVDAHDSVQSSLAIRSGRIVYVGDDGGVAAFTGPKTTVIDLQGRMLMPGLVDGHSHPLQGGATLLKCTFELCTAHGRRDAGQDSGLSR